MKRQNSRELKDQNPSQFMQYYLAGTEKMDNPFQQITDAFHPDYRVNLSIQGLDGSIMLTLSNESGIVAKRLLSSALRNDPKRLKRLIESIKFGIAIEEGHSAIKVLAAMTDSDGKLMPPHNVSPRPGRPALAAGL